MDSRFSGIEHPWRVPIMWPNSTILVLGNGPSLGLLKDIGRSINYPTIAVHHAFQIGPWVNILFIADARFYWEMKPVVDRYEGLKVSTNIYIPGKWYSLQTVDKIRIVNVHPGKGLTKDRTVLRYNGSGGACAINLAYHCGARRIILLGFDMRVVDGRKHYFPTPHTRTDGMKKWPVDKIWQPVMRDAKKLGVEIFNATPNSAMSEVVPRINLKDVL